MPHVTCQWISRRWRPYNHLSLLLKLLQESNRLLRYRQSRLLLRRSRLCYLRRQERLLVQISGPELEALTDKESARTAEDLLSQIAGSAGKEGVLQRVSESVLASTATLPENIRMQVIQSMQDIQHYIDHGLLTPATEECLRVIDLAPQYLDIHQVLCEIYIRQGKSTRPLPNMAS